MTILSAAYPFAPVGPNCVGGAEQMLSKIDCALVQHGHRSLVITAKGSQVSGTLVPLNEVASHLDDDALKTGRLQCMAIVEDVLRTENIDVVHMHGVDFPEYLPEQDVPVLATLHLWSNAYPSSIFSEARQRLFLNCVSRAQGQACPPCAYMLDEIPNGVEMPEDQGHAREEFVLMLGRICPEKGFHLGLEAADRAGVRAIVAGELFPYPYHQAYFNSELQPRLHPPHQYVGPAGRESKCNLYRRASSVLIPSTVPETSSLVALEAMSHGTPVIAWRRGALSEIVADGQTGFLVNSVEEMAEAIRRLDRIDSSVCRARVKEQYSLPAMIGRYFRVDQEIAGSGRSEQIQHA